MWNELCDDAHEANSMRVIHRAVMTIAFSFLAFGGYAIGTRLGADVPPSSVTYGTEKAPKGAAVFGD
jgi:hypothetical protein